MNDAVLICTDLDRTLIPNGKQPEAAGARERFARLVALPEVRLAYVTGRHRELVEEAMTEYRLPRPDYVIGDVGTSIYEIRGGDWSAWPAWHAAIEPDWAGFDRIRLAGLFDDLSPLTLQEEEKQNRFKLSYYAPQDSDHRQLLETMQQRLQVEGVRASLIWSIDEMAGIGLLDVLPASATKLHAIRFLIEHHGFAYRQTVFAGDSGNDLPVLCSEIQSVLVANASAAVRDEARRLAGANGHSDTLYCAQGGTNQHNGNYSDGILEGVFHYLPELRKQLNNIRQA